MLSIVLLLVIFFILISPFLLWFILVLRDNKDMKEENIKCNTIIDDIVKKYNLKVTKNDYGILELTPKLTNNDIIKKKTIRVEYNISYGIKYIDRILSEYKNIKKITLVVVLDISISSEKQLIMFVDGSR